MKILYVLDDTMERPDGVQQYIRAVGSWMSLKGHNVHVACGGASDSSSVLKIRGLAKTLDISFNGNKLAITLPISRRKLKHYLLDENFDIIHIQLPCNPLFGQLLINMAHKYCKDTKLVGTFHILPYGLLPYMGARLLGFWQTPTVKKLDKVLAVTESAGNLVSKMYKSVAPIIIPNTINIKSYERNKKVHNAPLKILFLGRLVKRKGCMELLRALALIDSPYQAVIVGDGPERKKLEKYALQNSLPVTFLGHVSERAKKERLASADILVFPSMGGESFGIVLLEAMAWGNGVVLAGNNPGYSSVMESIKEVLFDSRDTGRTSEIIHYYLTHDAQRNKVIKAQKNLVRKFDVDVVCDQILNIYTS